MFCGVLLFQDAPIGRKPFRGTVQKPRNNLIPMSDNGFNHGFKVVRTDFIHPQYGRESEDIPHLSKANRPFDLLVFHVLSQGSKRVITFCFQNSLRQCIVHWLWVATWPCHGEIRPSGFSFPCSMATIRAHLWRFGFGFVDEGSGIVPGINKCCGLPPSKLFGGTGGPFGVPV